MVHKGDYKVFYISLLMSRPLRIEYPGAFYHITSRDNTLMPIFDDVEDRECFIGIIEVVVKRFDWMVHANYMNRPKVQ